MGVQLNRLQSSRGTGYDQKTAIAGSEFEENSMSESIAVVIETIIELFILLSVLWFLTFLSTLFHELGHALGYRLATGDRHWHIRVGWGKRLLHTKVLTVNLLVFDGLFTPSKKEYDTRAKLITTLSGGPAASLLLVLALFLLRSRGLSFQLEFLADGVMEYFLNYAFFLNLYILLLSVSPIRYFHGEVKGMESDGLQIIHAMRKNGD